MKPISKANEKLVGYTISTLQSLGKLANFFNQNNQADYHVPIGSHIRHIIEHYEALIFRQLPSVNYDLRQRDQLLEKSPAEALLRISNLCKKLQEINSVVIEESIEVASSGGLLGELLFSHQSSTARELCFLNSHAIHHLAIIKPFCKQHDIPLDEYFGFAPSTIAYLESQKLET
ncbi:hypothetical protein ICN48_11600 [Polynucleobacter sp. JS-Safj-400b-B2]|uniref:hypothetical protein n=1 Tax=Polynucleobacter sp. JS-Safj-400b-B2 TaxID=2576921 RepID=UPI001C0AE0C8|nr:hypothetical protein [Polynucleobacter sp. JS-Safj-400b-B2]MBU3626873.1 hypothetical protein [Polynucleobacter sp. JS-Safj-400b-B2]